MNQVPSVSNVQVDMHDSILVYMKLAFNRGHTSDRHELDGMFGHVPILKHVSVSAQYGCQSIPLCLLHGHIMKR